MSGTQFGVIKSYHKNQIIFKAGQPGNIAYLIKTGEVCIYKIIDGKKKVLNTLCKGEVFGEMGMITESPRTAYAEATEYCDLVLIDQQTLYSMLKQSPKLVQSITLLLMKRLASTLEMLDSEEEPVLEKKSPAVSEILGLMADYKEDIDYILFCKKIISITHISQQKLEVALQELIENHAIEVVRDDDNAGSGWKLRIVNASIL